MTAADQSPFDHAARELGVWPDTVSYKPLDPDEAPRWLADQDMTARLHMAIQELLALCADNVEDTRLRVLLAEFSTEACAKAGVTAPYYALVEAEAALFACYTMHRGHHTPLGHAINACLTMFELLPHIVQQHLLLSYPLRPVMCSDCCAHPDDPEPTP
jgi:hypothetical protein